MTYFVSDGTLNLNSVNHQSTASLVCPLQICSLTCLLPTCKP